MREYSTLFQPCQMSMAVQIVQNYMRCTISHFLTELYNQAEAMDDVTSINQDRLNESRRQSEGRKQTVVYQ